MSYPIQNMPSGYEVKAQRVFKKKQYHAIVVYNYPAIRKVVTHAIISDESEMVDQYTTAIFRIKWKN